MRGLVSLESSGLKEFIAEMEGFVEAFPECSRIALDAQEKFVVDKIKQNWASMVPNAATGDFVYSCIGHSTELSVQNSYSVVGTVGVYKLDKIDAQFGKKKSDLNAAQLAYWVEFGTSRLKFRGSRNKKRKKKGQTYTDEMLVTNKPVPFMSNAFYSTIEQQEEVFKTAFNQAMQRFSYSG